MSDHELYKNEALIYQNIIETQKTQADFFKWKLIATAAIGAAAIKVYPFDVSPNLKINGGYGSGIQNYIICLIPLVCAYTDAVFLHLWFRINIISKYFRGCGEGYFFKYEMSIQKMRNNGSYVLKLWFHVERGVVFISSLILNSLVIVYSSFDKINDKIVYYSFGFIGILLTIVLLLLSILKESSSDELS